MQAVVDRVVLRLVQAHTFSAADVTLRDDKIVESIRSWRDVLVKSVTPLEFLHYFTYLRQS